MGFSRSLSGNSLPLIKLIGLLPCSQGLLNPEHTPTPHFYKNVFNIIPHLYLGFPSDHLSSKFVIALYEIFFQKYLSVIIVTRSPTWSGALPTNVNGSSSVSSWGKMGAKYGELRILSTRSLSNPYCFTWAPASWESTRICSWHTYGKSNGKWHVLNTLKPRYKMCSISAAQKLCKH
jgi:hypothetical protein